MKRLIYGLALTLITAPTHAFAQENLEQLTDEGYIEQLCNS